MARRRVYDSFRGYRHMRNSFDAGISLIPSQPSYAYGAGTTLEGFGMTNEEYLKLSAVTDDTSLENMARRQARLTFPNINRLHAIVGVVTEAGELADALKKEIFYGKPMDPTNIKEEIGDILWYIALLLRESNLTFDECMEANIAKLKKRYGDKFTEHAALNRDTAAEYRELETIKNAKFKIRLSTRGTDMVSIYHLRSLPKNGAGLEVCGPDDATLFTSADIPAIREFFRDSPYSVDYVRVN